MDTIHYQQERSFGCTGSPNDLSDSTWFVSSLAQQRCGGHDVWLTHSHLWWWLPEDLCGWHGRACNLSIRYWASFKWRCYDAIRGCFSLFPTIDCATPIPPRTKSCQDGTTTWNPTKTAWRRWTCPSTTSSTVAITKLCSWRSMASWATLWARIIAGVWRRRPGCLSGYVVHPTWTSANLSRRTTSSPSEYSGRLACRDSSIIVGGCDWRGHWRYCPPCQTLTSMRYDRMCLRPAHRWTSSPTTTSGGIDYHLRWGSQWSQHGARSILSSGFYVCSTGPTHGRPGGFLSYTLLRCQVGSFSIWILWRRRSSPSSWVDYPFMIKHLQLGREWEFESDAAILDQVDT